LSRLGKRFLSVGPAETRRQGGACLIENRSDNSSVVALAAIPPKESGPQSLSSGATLDHA
jgi:hypothetical protein